MAEQTEQQVRTMAGWIGVEISRSRVRTPGKAGYGLYRVRGSADRDSAYSEWTPYAFTLANLLWSVRGAIQAGTPAAPGPLRLLSGPEGLDRPVIEVPTRWTSRYRGRRDLGAPYCRVCLTGHEVTQRGGLVGSHRCPSGGLCSTCQIACARNAPIPVTVRREYADQLTALAALVDAGLVAMDHAEACTCSGTERLMAECVRRTVERETVRARQREANAAFQAEHGPARDAGLRARHAAKLGRTDERGV